MEEGLKNRDSIERLRFDVFHIVDGGSEVPLRNSHDPVAHVLRDETVIVPNDAYDGKVYCRENVRKSANDRKPSHDEDEDRHHNKRVGLS